jgi:hypothetical protein
MTVTSVETRYVHEVAAEVRAMAARHQVTGKQIGQYLGHDEMWASRRMRGATPWTGADLVRLSGLFHCRPSDLLPHLDSNQKPFDYRFVLAA